MKIILDEDVKGKGKKGQMIEVADGYGSFLIRSKKASLATEGVINKWKRIHEEETLQDNLIRKEATNLKNLIEKETFTFKVKAENGKVFGSITNSDVAKKLNEKYSNQTIKIEKKDVTVPKTSTLGVYQAKVVLYKDIVAVASINVSE